MEPNWLAIHVIKEILQERLMMFNKNRRSSTKKTRQGNSCNTKRGRKPTQKNGNKNYKKPYRGQGK